MEKPTITKYSSPDGFPHDLTVSGILVGINSDDLEYTSKKTGLRQTLKRAVLVLQSPIGIVLCRSYNSDTDLSIFKVGQSYTFPIREYKIDNGVKSASISI